MVRIASSLVLFSSLLSIASAAPLQKRIAQVIAESTAEWEKACIAAGGAQKCNPISQEAFSSLLAAGKACGQQDAADKMVDLAKELNNDAEMIRLAQLFVQQPRNAPDSLQVPYCQTAPKNSELDGLFHCQFAGSKFPQFSGDQTGNLPLGVKAVNPEGSCPAKPDGPVPDGVQLNTLVQDPGAAGGSSGSKKGNKGNKKGAGKEKADEEANEEEANEEGNEEANEEEANQEEDANEEEASEEKGNKNGGKVKEGAKTGGAGGAAGGDFKLQNGKDAKALNVEFATLTADSACTDGENACVENGFAQCVGGKFTITPCGSGLVCAALPLVNKAGTSIACTTQADVDARIAATGA